MERRRWSFRARSFTTSTAARLIRPSGRWTKILDARNNSVLAEANLLGRSKASSSSGQKNLSEGAGKALAKWLKQAGLPEIKEKDKKEKEEPPEDEAVMDKRA